MEKKKPHHSWISVDFDGVISTYSGWKGFDVLGTPIMEVVVALRECRKRGYKIVIFTTRLDTPCLRHWLDMFNVPYDSINSTAHNPPHTSNKPIAHAIIDDRAICYSGQRAGELVEQIEEMINRNSEDG